MIKIREFISTDLDELEPNHLCPDKDTMRQILDLNDAEIFTVVDGKVAAILCAIPRRNNIWTAFILAAKDFQSKHCRYLQKLLIKAIRIYNPKLLYSVSEDVPKRNRLHLFLGMKRRRKISYGDKNYYIWAINGR